METFVALIFYDLVWLVLHIVPFMGNHDPPFEDILVDALLMKGSYNHEHENVFSVVLLLASLIVLLCY